jgi:hypothetical protein
LKENLKPKVTPCTTQVVVTKDEETALIDVLIDKKGYYVKSPGTNGKKGTLSFKKHGGADPAWTKALETAFGVSQD